MSISIDRFGSTGRWSGGRDIMKMKVTPPPTNVVSELQCHCCGYVPATRDARPARCPKCGSGAWERWTTRRAPTGPAEDRRSVVADIGRALVASHQRH